jgi:preprotein translocase subunit YajC
MDTAVTQAVAKVGQAGAPASMGYNLLPFQIILIMALFYFLMIHPQSKERKKREDLLNNVQRGDRVLTRGGIYGTVADIKENILIVKISENNKVEVDRAYVELVQKQG